MGGGTSVGWSRLVGAGLPLGVVPRGLGRSSLLEVGLHTLWGKPLMESSTTGNHPTQPNSAAEGPLLSSSAATGVP